MAHLIATQWRVVLCTAEVVLRIFVGCPGVHDVAVNCKHLDGCEGTSGILTYYGYIVRNGFIGLPLNGFHKWGGPSMDPQIL